MRRVYLIMVIAILGTAGYCIMKTKAQGADVISRQQREQVKTDTPVIQKVVITESQAISIAEEFVKQNGYTDLPPSADISQLSRESLDSEDPEEALESRRNTLERKAIGAKREVSGSYTGGWMVVFRYNRDNLELRQLDPDFDELVDKYGRAIKMNEDGSNVRIVHQEIMLEVLPKQVDK